MFNQQQLFETLLGGSNNCSISHQTVPNAQPTNYSPSSGATIPTTITHPHHGGYQPQHTISNNQTQNNAIHHTNNITNENILQQHLLYNQLVLMNQALSQNLLLMSTTNNTATTTSGIQHITSSPTTMYHSIPITQPPSLLSVLSSLTAVPSTTNQPLSSSIETHNNNTTNGGIPSLDVMNSSCYFNKNSNMAISGNLMNNSNIHSTNISSCNTTTTMTNTGLAPVVATSSSKSNNNANHSFQEQQQQHIHEEMEDTAKPWLFMLENMLKQRPTTNNTSSQANNSYQPQTNMVIPTSNVEPTFSFNQHQYSGFSRESNLSPSIFQELDDIIGSIDPNVDICEKLSFEKKEEKPSFNVIVKQEAHENSPSPLPSLNNTMGLEEKKKRTKRTGQGRGGNTGGKYLAESASREVSPTFDYFVYNSENSMIVKAEFEGVVLTPHERCLCALLSKAVLPREDLKTLISGPNSVTLRCIISKWLFGKLDVYSGPSQNSVEESTNSAIQINSLTMVCDPMGFTVNKSAKPTRLSVFVNDTLKLRINPSTFETSPLFDNDTIIADILMFNQNMMNLFIDHYSIEMRSAHYLTGLTGGLSKESDLSTTNIMNTPDICMELLSDNSIIQFSEDLSKSNSKLTSDSDDTFDVCVSVRRDHHYKVKLPPIKEVSQSLGFGNTSPNSALNKKISFIQIVESDSQRPVCRSEPFWCRSKSRAEMEKKQNREAMQRKTVKKEGEKKRKPKSPTEQEKKRKYDE